MFLGAPGAQARKQGDFAYPTSLVWTAAVRLMRVDFSSPIREKDREEGYFIFDYEQGGRVHVGSVEVLPARTREGSVARVVIKVAGLPSYVEAMMLSRLERKLAKEYGPPRTFHEDSDEQAKDDQGESEGEADGSRNAPQNPSGDDTQDDDATDSSSER